MVKITKPLAFLIKLIIGGFSFYVGIKKAIVPADFLEAIENYRLLPYALAWFTAFYLPYLETLCGGLFLLNINTSNRAVTLILIGLMVAFIFALLPAWARGLDIDCGCFGKASSATAPQYLKWLLRNGLFLSGLLSLFWFEKGADSPKTAVVT